MNKQETTTKKCSTCKEHKTADTNNFFPFHMAKDGLSNRCQQCEIARRTEKGKIYYERAKQKQASKTPSVKEPIKFERKPIKPPNELDRLFSLIIRNAHPKRCHNCGKYGEVDDLQCGHVVNRTKFNVRYDLRNALPVCLICNYYDDNHTKALIKRVIELYGENAYDEINIKKFDEFKPSQGQRQFLEKMFKTLLKSLNTDTERNVQKLIETQKMIDTLFCEVV